MNACKAGCGRLALDGKATCGQVTCGPSTGRGEFLRVSRGSAFTVLAALGDAHRELDAHRCALRAIRGEAEALEASLKGEIPPLDPAAIVNRILILVATVVR